jgi:hypothetical protein
MDLTKLTQGDRIVLGAGILLLVSLLFFPWHHIDVASVVLPGIGAVAPGGTSVNITAVNDPHAGYGLLALILTIVMIAQIAASKLFGAQLPDPPVPWPQIHMIAGIAVFVLLLIKLLAETSSLGFGAYVGLLLAAGLAFGGYTMRQEVGGYPIEPGLKQP